MDPDGSLYFYFALLSVLSFVFCLYTAVKVRQDEDGGFALGVSPGVVSSALLYLACRGIICAAVLPKLPLWQRVVCGAIFILLSTALPFCTGLAIWEKLGFVTAALSPVITVMNLTVTNLAMLPAKAVFSAFRLKAEDEVTAQDVMDLVEDAHEDVIDEDQKEMIENIFELDEMSAGDIMTHRTDVTAFDGRQSRQDVIDIAVQSGFSRIPVYDGTIDTIVGVLYTKDLIPVIGDDEKLKRPVSDFMRKAMFVPEACAARELLVQFKKTRSQMAIVVDEYGGTSGIVTMEDILEEIVGNIQDEYDNEEELYTQNPDGSYTCLGAMEVEDLLELLDIPPQDREEDDEDFDSVGGLIINKLGRIPTPGESRQVEYKGVMFTVLEVADRRIIKVKAEKLPQSRE